MFVTSTYDMLSCKKLIYHFVNDESNEYIRCTTPKKDLVLRQDRIDHSV
jgi:hypothetical protein